MITAVTVCTRCAWRTPATLTAVITQTSPIASSVATQYVDAPLQNTARYPANAIAMAALPTHELIQ